jgi:HEAT repeat protein
MEQASTPLTGIHIVATWKSTVVAVRDGEYDVQLQLTDPRFKGDAVKDAQPAALSALQARLSRPFWATCRQDGGLLQMHFLRDVSFSDRNILQSIATDLQLVRPEPDSVTAGQALPESWTAQERDGAGEYSALYLAQPGRILKRKLTYLYTDGVAGAPAGSMRISVDQSEITFTMADDQRVQAIDGANRVRMNWSEDKSQQLATTTEFHVGHLQSGQAPELVGSLERAAKQVVDLAIVTQRPDAGTARADADDRLLKGISTEAILAQAFAVKSTHPAQPERLSALFRCRPEAAAQAEILLIRNGSRKTVTNALGAAGSPSAVTVLGKLARNATLSQELRVDALVAFVQMKHPTRDAMQIPVAMLQDPNAAIQSAARMISGALARQGRAEHSTEADVIDASLLAFYQNATEAHERVELLAALGNSAGPATLPAIEQALHDPADLIRSAAARALRLATDSDADHALASVLVHDAAPTVRADAIFATQFRRPLPSSLTDALLQVVNSDNASFVRSDAIAVLARNLTASPKIGDVLAQVATTDPDPGIRHQAKSAIATWPISASTVP